MIIPKNRMSIISILFGASAWGSLGVFATALYRSGLSPLDIAAARTTVAWIGFAVLLVLSGQWHQQQPKLGTRAWLVVHGLITVALYNILYFISVVKVGIAISAVLLYSAPIWSTIIGYLLLHERHANRVYWTMPVTLIGVALMVYKPSVMYAQIPWLGVLAGLGSAITYALFSILGKPFLKNLSLSWFLFYSFGSAALVLDSIIVWRGGWHRFESLTNEAWMLVVAIGILPTFLAYIFYTHGLRYTPATVANVLSAVEPVVAVLLGMAVFDEILTPYEFSGMFLVVLAATLIGYWHATETSSKMSKD